MPGDPLKGWLEKQPLGLKKGARRIAQFPCRVHPSFPFCGKSLGSYGGTTKLKGNCDKQTAKIVFWAGLVFYSQPTKGGVPAVLAGVRVPQDGCDPQKGVSFLGRFGLLVLAG